MSTGERHEDSSKEMFVNLPPLKWPRETFDSMVRNFKFPDSWDARYPDEGQTAVDAPAGYITLFWDFFSAGNFRLSVTKFFLEIRSYYKFHISQMHPIGMVRVHHFEFVCRSMHIEPTDLKDVPSIVLPEKALVGAGMSLFWRMEREDKPIYMEDSKVVSLYVIAFERDGGSMATIPKRADAELWYLQIVKYFALPRDKDLAAQPPTGAGELTNLGIGPEKKKRAPATNIGLNKTDTAKAQSSKVKNVKGEKKGTRHSSDSWCDYVVVKPKAEPRDAADILASNADDPIDLESSPEPLLKTKVRKRKQAEVDAEAQPAKKVQKRKITRRGNLDAFIVKPPPEKPISPVHAEPSSAINEDLPPSPPRAPISEQLESTKTTSEDEAEQTAEAGNPEVEKPVEVVVETEKVVDPETAEVESAHPKSPEVVARDTEKGKFAQEDHVTIFPTSTSVPVNVEMSPACDQGSFSYDVENSPIRPDETPRDYYYRTYSEEKAAEIHTPVWNLKKGGTFSDWRVCRDWLKGTFSPGEI
ncbi:hypothetical protein Hanom_Chr03g00232031 [Helianthus anomalus]